MKKMMFAALSLVCMFAVAGGSGAPRADAAATGPAIGGCRWVCAGISTRFTTEAACEAVCPTECEVLC
jgi:hypothetical protein